MFDGTAFRERSVRPHPAKRPTTWIALTGAVRSAWERRRSRRAIADLDRFLLKDIGVSYAEAEAEANKPFWVP